MADARPPLNRLEIVRSLRYSNWEAVFSTAHVTLTGGAFQTGFALLVGANNLWMGVLSSFPTFAGLVQVIASYAVERRGERKWFTAWLATASRAVWLPILLVPFLLPVAARLPAFVVLLLASSVLLSAAVPAATSWLADLVPPDHRGRFFGRRNMLAGITTMVVSLPAAWYLDLAGKGGRSGQALGFAVLFGLSVVAGLVSFLCFARQAEPPMRAAGTASGGVSLRDALTVPFADRGFRNLAVFGGVFALAQFFAAPFYTVYALKVLRLDYVWLQVLGAVASLSGLLAMPMWGYLSDRYGNKPLMAISVAGIALLPLPWVFTRADHPAAALVILTLNNLAGGVFWGGAGLTQFNLLVAGTPSERKSIYIAAMSAVSGLAGGLAPILGGIVVYGLRGIDVPIGSWHLSNYHVVFVINAALRVVTLLFLRGVEGAGATSTRDVLQQLSSVKVGTIVHMRRLQHGQSEQSRRQAVQALRRVSAALAVDELIVALDDPSLHVREEAAQALGEIGDRRAAPALIQMLADRASGVVDEAADALGRLHDARAVEPLARVLAEYDAPDRIAAARALGRLGAPAAVPALLDALDRAERAASPDEMEAAMQALGRIGSPEAASALHARLASPLRTVRLAAARALGEIASSASAEPLLALLAGEADEAVIAHAAVALGQIGVVEAAGPLLATLARVSSPVARKQVLLAAGALAGVAEGFYPMLAQESFARDHAVSRILREAAARGARRRPRASGNATQAAARVLEEYIAGDYTAATARMVALAGPAERVPGALGAVLAWATGRAGAGGVRAEEFLLALYAVRAAGEGRLLG